MKKFAHVVCVGLVLLFCVAVQEVYAMPPKYLGNPAEKIDEQRMMPVVANDTFVSAFRNLKMVPSTNILVPTVVEVPLSLDVSERSSLAVYEVSSQQFVPYFIHETYDKKPTPVSASSGMPNDGFLTDGKLDQGVDYFLDETEVTTIAITLTSAELVESSSIVFDFDQYVALPIRASVSALVDGVTERTIVAPTRMYSNVVSFPKTRANRWTITLTYAQPLRINEIRLIQDFAQSSMTRGVRFLAQPGNNYMVYHNPDRSVAIPTIEGGNLSDNANVLLLPSTQSLLNQLYREADVDGDGIHDIRDNCVQTANPDQVDIDQNGRGDACDDFDRDGFMQVVDNCPNQTNENQFDADGDGIGDACDDEENRFTEKYPWVPWAGMGIAAFVIGILFFLVGVAPKNTDEDTIV